MKKYYKVGPFGLANIIKFINLPKTRKDHINSTKPKAIKGDYPINNMARLLHPDYQQVVIDEVINYGSAGAKTYILKSTDPVNKPLAFFRAGQYISVKAKLDGKFISRPYSISSSPLLTKENLMAITIKTNPSGYAAEKFLKEFEKGTKLIVSAPSGQFYYEPLRDAKNVIALAGGSGITPFLSMACAIRDGIEDFNLTILLGSKDAESILFLSEFETICKATDKVTIVHVLSDDTGTKSLTGAKTESGFITADIIKKYAPKDEPYSIFICGPTAMYDFLDKELKKLDIEDRYIRKELLGVTDKVYDVPNYPKEKSGNTYTINVKCGPKETAISAKGDEPILSAIERTGIKAPSSCRSGECGYCRSKLVSGSVYVPQSNDGRRYSDIECGYIHPCATFPTSDLVIEIPGEYF